MKKIIGFCSLFFVLFLVTSCVVGPTLRLDRVEINLAPGDEYELKPIVKGLADYTIEYSLNNEGIIEIENGVVSALSVGTSIITISIKDQTIPAVTLKVNVIEHLISKIEINGPSTVEQNKEITLVYTLTNLEGEVLWSSSNEQVAIVTDGIVKGKQQGTVQIIAQCGDYYAVHQVEVIEEVIPLIMIEGDREVDEGKSISLSLILEHIAGSAIWSSSDEEIAIVEDGVVWGIKAGTVLIRARIGEVYDEIVITVKVKDDFEKPVFVLGDDYLAHTKINWNKPFDPFKDIQALDNVDGDITQNLRVVSDFDNQVYGIHTIEIEIADQAGNINTMTRTVEVEWNYDVIFIGHAGCYYGLMNSEEAFLYAVQVLKYQALECDLKQTSDGVFVMSHDDTFGGYTIQSTPWSVLKDVEVTASRSAGYPAQNGSVTGSPYTTKLCTLERYLEICREYNVKAVIELKASPGITNTNQSRMQALMNEIERCQMREHTIFLGSQYNCLIWTRQNGYSDIECQYLVNSFESETIFQRCLDYNLDISINVTGDYSNNDEWLARYQDEGIKVSTYTFTQWVDYNIVQLWIDKGVDYVTVDWHLMSELRLPEDSKIPLPTYEVTFKDYDGTLLKVATVKAGRTAAAPSVPSRLGYTFTGWDKDISNVTTSFEVIAEYDITTYTINYQANIATLTPIAWASKADFIDEFYNDLYQWLITNGASIPEITVIGNNVTMVKNGKSVSFSDVNGLKALDIYDFEKTISNIMYKPVVRGANDSAVHEASELYFLNSELYRLKYQALDAWFVNCINVAYPAYSKTYAPLSDGRIQIMFRFHQWQKGTNIPAFNALPLKYIVSGEEMNYELPTSNLTYTIEDEFDLPLATGDKAFLGWYLDQELTQRLEKIDKGRTGNLILYAKWDN